MTLHALLPFTSAALCSGLAVFVLWGAPHAFAHRMFAVGMGALAWMEVFAGIGAQAQLPMEVTYWEHLSLIAAAFVPGSWLLFSLSFGRSNYRELVVRWRGFVLIAFILPLVLVIGFPQTLFASLPVMKAPSVWLIPLGWSGYGFYFLTLLSSVVVLTNLEKTLRVFAGSMRWQIKFMILGLGSLFAVQIYTSSQALLFFSIHTALTSVNSTAIIVADLLIIISFIRHRLLNVDIYLSRTVFYNSITIIVVGIYLLAVGVLAKVINYFGGSKALPLGTFFVFLALVALTIVLLSDQLRHGIKRFISRHFYRAQYDYRQEWMACTQRMTSVMDVKELCRVIARMVSETFGVPAVTIWLTDEEAQEKVILGGSTVMSDTHQFLEAGIAQGVVDLVSSMRKHPMPVNFSTVSGTKVKELQRLYPEYFHETQTHYGVTLVAGQQLLGMMTLSPRLMQEAFSYEDYDLLKTIADQAAASLLNLKLSQRLLKAKEMEAFQTLSAFFVHDLKNLATKLSLMLQNLPAHYDNPAFRDDMLHVIAGSVSKMNAMCSRLSLLSGKLELHREEVDLNELVRGTTAELYGSLCASLSLDLQPMPCAFMDREQLQKVLVNILLNAAEAVGEQGEILVATARRDRSAVLTVSDNGCGMSQEFLTRLLFKPFQTTKSQGLGIGMFHSKMIVEAHQGRIEVESRAGEGTTFRVFLPLSVSSPEVERVVVSADTPHAILHT